MDLTKKLTKALIEMYWERKCLWQVHSEDYKRREVKKRAYLEIVSFLRRNGVKDADVKQVRDKIQNLRRAMRKEKKRIDDSGGTYSPTLWYYDLLTFVNEPSEENTSSKIVTVDVDSMMDDHCYSHIETLDEAYKEISPKRSVSPISDVIIKSPHPSDTVPQKLDEFDAMGVNVAAKVRRMESTQQILAELLIQKVVARGLLGQLNNTTEIMDLPEENGTIIRVVSASDAYRKLS